MHVYTERGANGLGAGRIPEEEPGCARPLVSVVVPVFDEAPVLETFHRRLAAALKGLPVSAEIVYVDDGSDDDSVAVLYRLREEDARIAVLQLSRNFGKEAAMAAGLDHASGDAVVLIDADLQDPPELIPEMVEAWCEGADVVTMRRATREGESLLKRASASAFYRLLDRVSDTPIPVDTGDFRLMSRPVVEALRAMPERNRYSKGLFAWVGFRRRELLYAREARCSGRSHLGYARLLALALDGVTSFSRAPLRLSTYAGVLVAGAALVFAAWTFAKALIFGDPVAGYPSLMTVALLLGGVQLLALGVHGEYLGRIYAESKQRPVYVLEHVEPARREKPSDRAMPES